MNIHDARVRARARGRLNRESLVIMSEHFPAILRSRAINEVVKRFTRDSRQPVDVTAARYRFAVRRSADSLYARSILDSHYFA